MKSKLMVLALSLMVPGLSNATRVAVADSGTDFSHQWMKSRALINQKEIAGNLVDDDRNGKVDDIVGWNFVENYSRVFFPEHLENIDEKIYKIFELIARIEDGTMTEADKKYWQDNVKGLPQDQKNALIAKLNFFGQYAHGTHVSGIIAKISPDSKIMSARVFPDTPPEDSQPAFAGDFKSKIADMAYKFLAALTNGTFEKVGTYLDEQKIDVANYSLGVSLQNLAKLSLGLQGVNTPTPEQLSAEAKKMAVHYEAAGRKWISASPGTLFVIAAGNDGTNNDALPTFPANVRMDNTITIAASHGVQSLATFSNYGMSVDLAAPGVGIISSVPGISGTRVLPMSGTSMASPYVAGVAARAKELNPNLKPAELKQILMGTVDKKEWLKTKVISSGVINPARVFAAAERSKTMSISQAIEAAKVSVKDQTDTLMALPKVPMTPLMKEMKAFAKEVVL